MKGLQALHASKALGYTPNRILEFTLQSTETTSSQTSRSSLSSLSAIPSTSTSFMPSSASSEPTVVDLVALRAAFDSLAAVSRVLYERGNATGYVWFKHGVAAQVADRVGKMSGGLDVGMGWVVGVVALNGNDSSRIHNFTFFL
jgi:hypothetical protein